MLEYGVKVEVYQTDTLFNLKYDSCYTIELVGVIANYFILEYRMPLKYPQREHFE